MPELVLGPLLRYVGETCAVFWVETDTECEVSVLGASARTWEVEGHHYAIVRPDGLEPGSRHEYEVELDGEAVWPPAGSPFPPSQFRTHPKDRLQIAFGSCRVAVPSALPYTLPKEQDEHGYGHDALRALALGLHARPLEEWPDLLLLLGDQVYADECSPEVKKYIRSHRDPGEEPGMMALGFEEYTRLYRESWGEPVIRWLLSTVPTAMIFDDHDVHDDWNSSETWLAQMRATDWWDEHIEGALVSYWIYQHAGNLSPDEQDEDGLLERVREARDAGAVLSDFARGADRERGRSRWSFARDLGGTRLVMIDSRAGRVLEEDRRSMLDEAEWRWVEEHATGGFDHLLLATSLPWLISPGMHHLEAWNEAVCGGAWGGRAARAGEWLRQRLDLEHWAAFDESFRRLAEIQRSVGAGERGEPPASIVTLSGDVHHAYLSHVAFPRGTAMHSAVFQAVCSPMRNPLDSHERQAIKTLMTRPAAALMRGLSKAAGVAKLPVRWRLEADGPWFDNQVAMLHVDGRRMEFEISKSLGDPGGEPRLERVHRQRLA